MTQLYGKYGRIDEAKLLGKLGVNANAVELVKSIALISREDVLVAWQSKHDVVYNDVDVIIDNIRYSSITQIENKYGQILPSSLILNRIFDQKMSTVAAVLQEYLTVTTHGKVHNDEHIFTLHEALSYYNIPEYMVSELHEFTGLPPREIIYLMMYFRPKVEEFYNNKVRNNKVEVLEKVKPVTVSTTTKVDTILTTDATRYTPVKPIANNQPQSRPIQSNSPKPVNNRNVSTGKIVPSKDIVDFCSALNIDPILYELDIRKGLTHEKAIARQTARVGSRKTNNAMTINGVHYNSQREVCQIFELNETEVAFFKSREGCTSYEAVMVFINQKYGAGTFR